MKLYKGKTTCRILKDIRRQIAEENDIELVIKECTYQGDCLGTCPRCEAEVAYLEKELAKREAMGKAVRVTGLAAASFAAAACSIKPQQKQPTEQPEILQGDIALADSTESEFVQPNEDSAWIAGGKRLTEEEMMPTAGKPAPDAVAPTKNSKKEAPLNEEDEIELVAPDVTRCRPLAGVIARPRLEGEDEEEANAPTDTAAVSDEILYLEEGDAEEPPFTVVEQMPEYPGGEEALFKYLGENITYPQTQGEAEPPQGRVILQFVVSKTGEVTDVEVKQSSGDDSLDREAERVVKSMPNWIPGQQRGKNVPVLYHVPINFKLTD